MDALRASSMFLLIPAHAAILLAINGHPGAWSSAIFWTIHLFRLPLFFAMSGFFLVLLLGSKGLRRTARNRTLRIVVPLAVGLVTLVPLYVLASQLTNTVIAADGEQIEGTPFIFEPSYLWFLWYLLIIDGLAIASYLLLPGLLRAGERGFRAAMGRPLLGVLVLAVPTALVLLPYEAWVMEPDTATFVPEPAALAYYGIFFAFGASLSANRDLITRASAKSWSWSAWALVATIPAGAFYALHNSAAHADRFAIHVSAMLIYAIATWTCLVALVALASRYLAHPRPATRYIADCSYWIYLSHLPAMVLLIALAGILTLGTAPAYAFVVIATLAFAMATYPLFVRYTPIGTMLNGRRERPSRPRREPPAQAEAEAIESAT
ncbi:MAG: acyltransferase family protein [Thermoleophilia bacterium]|nr:acyltransferase family protein [Thermoleophilia bacterium]